MPIIITLLIIAFIVYTIFMIYDSKKAKEYDLNTKIHTETLKDYTETLKKLTKASLKECALLEEQNRILSQERDLLMKREKSFLTR